MENSVQKKSVFNTIFKTPFGADTKKKRTIYSSFLYSITALLFIFLVLALVVANSWTTPINSKLSSYSTDNLNLIFGTQNKYLEWSNSTKMDYDANIVIGGAVNMAVGFGKDSMVSAVTALSFVSLAMIIVTLCFKKNTIASFVLFGIEASLLITIFTLFIILVTAGGDEFKEYNDLIAAFDSKPEALSKEIARINADNSITDKVTAIKDAQTAFVDSVKATLVAVKDFLTK